MASRPERRCTVPGCPRRHQAKGLCHAHYIRRYEVGSRSTAPVRTYRRLTPPEVRDIRKHYGAGISMRALAADYGVAYVTVWRLLHGLRHAEEH